MTLLSLSPLLSTLFLSYANRAAALESASATPSPESEEWKELQATVSQQQKQIDALTAGLQKVSAQFGTSKPAMQTVSNKRSTIQAQKK